MVDTISASELKQTLDQFVIIDVREQDELANGTIDGSTHMPLGLAIRNVKQGKISELLSEQIKGKKICTFCASGYRANIAADELAKAGFDVKNLEGGFMAWQKV
jgi:rhodanese-related sulfurtransferase